MSKMKEAIDKFEEHQIKAQANSVIDRQIDVARYSGFVAGYKAACSHFWVCKQDGKHGRLELWECKHCGEIEYRN